MHSSKESTVLYHSIYLKRNNMQPNYSNHHTGLFIDLASYPRFIRKEKTYKGKRLQLFDTNVNAIIKIERAKFILSIPQMHVYTRRRPLTYYENHTEAKPLSGI
jgi:hypothetical protein